MTRSDCTSLQPLDAGRETTVAVSTMADLTVKGPKSRGKRVFWKATVRADFRVERHS